MTGRRPACPICGVPVDRMRRSLGIVAAYPCNHWLTPAQAADVQAEARALREQ